MREIRDQREKEKTKRQTETKKDRRWIVVGFIEGCNDATGTDITAIVAKLSVPTTK